MKSAVRMRIVSVALTVATILALATSAAAWAQEIPWGGPTDLPDYVGAPAKAHPAANSGVPQNPLLAPNGLNACHLDPWMSDTADLAGPLGANPAVLSTTLAEARRIPYPGDVPWIFECVTIMFDSHGRLVALCLAPHEATAVLLDPGYAWRCWTTITSTCRPAIPSSRAAGRSSCGHCRAATPT